ncbi:SpoIIE family protein phosphatase [Streptomyces sp. NPDC087894]|uniref:ATP-binding SpoIIE family protein phosphatase n=1 Tax=Streptomyces sp. NPDC087894 TaxID=3365816 RepID=UPI0037FEA8BB
MADALEDVIRGLGAYVAVTYLVDADTGDLVASVIGGEPPFVFTIPQRIARSSRLASGRLPLTNKLVSSALPLLSGGEEALRLIPIPSSFISAPLLIKGRALGLISALWLPPRPDELPSLESRMAQTAEGLARSLAESCSESVLSASPVSPTIIPMFGRIIPHEKTLPEGTQCSWGLAERPGSPSYTQMYQLHMLSEALNRACGISEVIRAANEWIVKPFGALTLIAAVAEQGRLQVVGYGGAEELAKSMHGQHVSRLNPMTKVISTKKPVYLSDPRSMHASFPDADFCNLQAVAVLPLPSVGQVIGSWLLGFGTPRVLQADEQVLLLMMAANLSVALQRERLSEAERMFADALQRELLPRTMPDWSPVVTAARYLSPSASAGMGGDWYDVIPLPEGQMGLVVGDVEGHGMHSAVIMGQLRSGLRAYAAEGHDPSDVLARSSALLSELDTDAHATCCFVRFDPHFGTAEIASAGHPPPVLRTPDGEVTVTRVPSNLPLAVMPGYRYVTAEVTVQTGGMLMLYTDGIARSSDNDPVSAARYLMEALADVKARSLESLADEATDQAARSPRREDDMVLLFASFEGNPVGPEPRVDHMWIPRHDIGGVRLARQFVHTYLERRQLAHLADDMELIVSELVTNALIHADSKVEVRLREYSDHIHVEVRDTDAKPPVPTSVTASDETNALAEHGRGMGIVDYLSLAWGNSPNGRGKTVWVDVPKQMGP